MSAHSQHPADAYGLIRVHGARQNNLKNISVEIPKRRLTVFTGVSGSGKSSLVFSTIAAESQRMINETYSAFLQGMMPSLDRPDVDLLDGLTTAIVVDQERMGANSRSTVGTVTDVNAMLRILFSRCGDPHIGSPNAFSFNLATVSGKGAFTVEKASAAKKPERAEFQRLGGMCPRCEGMGTANSVDLRQIIDETKSINDGAITVPGYKAGGWSVKFFSHTGLFDADKPIQEFSDVERHDFLYKEPTKIKIDNTNMTYQGLIPQIQKSMLSKDREAMQPHIRAFVDRAVTFTACPDCAGTRLNEAARSSLIAGNSIADVCAMEINDLVQWVAALDLPEAAPLVDSLHETLQHFVQIGLGYLSLDRSSSTLSGGEAQRVKMIKHLGSSLTDVTYVFDEPSIGLHPADIERMNALLLQLRDKGNTVLVVEHKPETIRIADHVVDMGPGAGSDGGAIVYTGDVEGLIGVTGEHLNHRIQVKPQVRSSTGSLEIRDASQHNLTGVDVDIPTGVLTAITGVAGSGKSSLINGNLAGREGVALIDQAPIKGSRRSNPATYTGLLEPIRKAFAKANGVKPALFSANSEGACPVCNGSGILVTDLGVMASVSTTCQECQGQRFQIEVLEYTLGAKNIAEVLQMPVAEAKEFFGGTAADGTGVKVSAAHTILGRLDDVGLGYLRLGQALNTLSGGERQRLKLAVHMSESAQTIVLDEPTTGLHLADVDHLLSLLDQLVDAGRTVIAIEHHQAVMAHADWIIDLGPGAGTEGGQVVFEGTPAKLAECRATLTGKYLATYVGA